MKLNLTEMKKAIGFTPYPWQQGILENQKRFTKIVGGKRTGKTFLTSYLGFRELLASDREVWIVAPTNELGGRIWDNIELWAREFPFLKARKQDLLKGRSIENLIGRSWLRIKSADIPTQLKGDAGDLLIVEEAGDMADDIWSKYLEPFISEIRPITGKKGRVLFIGNASHKGSWFHLKWEENEDDENISFWIPTAIEENGKIISSSNPLLAIEELERIKKGNPERVWKQEWLAEWLVGSGEVFRGIKAIANGEFRDPVGHFYYIGVDLGRLQDFTVITVVDSLTWEVVYWDRFKDIEWPFQRARIMAAVQRYGAYNSKVLIDQTGVGQPIVDELLREGLNIEGFTFTNESKKNLIEKLATLVENQKIRYPGIPELLQEMEVFTYKTLDSGRVQYSAPSGFHDDCVISLALAVKMLEGEPQTESKPATIDEQMKSQKIQKTNSIFSKTERLKSITPLV